MLIDGAALLWSQAGRAASVQSKGATGELERGSGEGHVGPEKVKKVVLDYISVRSSSL